MKTALIVLFALVTVAIAANIGIGRDTLRLKRDTSSVYAAAATAEAGASGEDAAVGSRVLQTAEGIGSESMGSAKRGSASSKASIGGRRVEKYD